MKRYISIIAFILFYNNVAAQTKAIRIGYIDMEYILEKVPDYANAKNQLEEKAQKWKQEMDVKNAAIAKLRESLKIEKVLLTKELIEEREEEIAFQEKELSDFQQKKFGPIGDLVTQKTVLVKPIQDAVFNIVQDIASTKKYDFVFDKSSDLTILFAEKRYNISDQVVRKLTQLERREQLSKKQLKEEELRERKQDLIDSNPDAVEAQKLFDSKKEARQKALDDRKLAADEKRKTAEEARKQLLADKLAAKSGTVSDKDGKTSNTVINGEDAKKNLEEKKALVEEARKKSIQDRQQILDDRKKVAEEKRLKIIADREAAKKAKEEAKK